MCTVALFISAKPGKQPKCPSTNGWIKQDLLCPFNEILFSLEKKGNLTHAIA
jgi:hypothetical protein